MDPPNTVPDDEPVAPLALPARLRTRTALKKAGGVRVTATLLDCKNKVQTVVIDNDPKLPEEMRGASFRSLSGAGKAVGQGVSVNGWQAWEVELAPDVWELLDSARDKGRLRRYLPDAPLLNSRRMPRSESAASPATVETARTEPDLSAARALAERVLAGDCSIPEPGANQMGGVAALMHHLQADREAREIVDAMVERWGEGAREAFVRCVWWRLDGVGNSHEPTCKAYFMRLHEAAHPAAKPVPTQSGRSRPPVAPSYASLDPFVSTRVLSGSPSCGSSGASRSPSNQVLSIMTSDEFALLCASDNDEPSEDDDDTPLDESEAIVDDRRSRDLTEESDGDAPEQRSDPHKDPSGTAGRGKRDAYFVPFSCHVGLEDRPKVPWKTLDKVPFRQWDQQTIECHLWHTPDEHPSDPPMLKITHFRRYGKNARYEFNCQFGDYPARSRRKRSAWIKFWCFLRRPAYMRILRDKHGWDMDLERDDNLEENEATSDVDFEEGAWDLSRASVGAAEDSGTDEDDASASDGETASRKKRRPRKRPSAADGDRYPVHRMRPTVLGRSR